MPKTTVLPILHLGDGLNTGLPASHIKTSEAVELENLRPYGTKLVRRYGMSKLTSRAYLDGSAALGALTSMFAFKTADGTWTLLVGARQGIGKLDGTRLSSISAVDNIVIPDSPAPMVWFQYKDVAYAIRKNNGLMKRVTPNYRIDAGIAAPTVAPALADGAAGVITAEDYYGVYTNFNSATYNESNYSPVSTIYTAPGSKKINWSNLQVPSNPQVNRKRLYRTLPGQYGQYFFVVEVGASDTGYTGDNILAQDLGVLASTKHGLPPTGCSVGELWYDRLFLTDGTNLYYSEVGLLECFGTYSVLTPYPFDGHEIRGLRAFGQRLLIGKTNRMIYLTGYDESTFGYDVLSDSHGCVSHHAMKTFEGRCMWLGPDGFYTTDGTTVTAVGDLKIRSLLDQIPGSLKEYAVACVFPEESTYLCTIPIDSTGYNKLVLVYNYRTDAWATYTHSPYSPSFIGEFFDENFERILLASLYDGHVYRYLDPSKQTDDGTAYTSKWLSKAFGLEFGQEHIGRKKDLRRFFLQATLANERDVTISVYNDGVLVDSRSVSLDRDGKAWRRWAFAGSGSGAETIQVGLEYSGDDPFEMEAVMIEAVLMQRATSAL